MKKYSQSGQSLIEILAAITVVVVIIIALVNVALYAVRNADFAKNKSLANKYLNQGLEAVRSIRDRNWDSLYSLTEGTNYYLIYNEGYWELTTSVTTPALGFNRTVTLTKDTDSVTVFINVSWNQGGKIASSSASARYTKWK